MAIGIRKLSTITPLLIQQKKKKKKQQAIIDKVGANEIFLFQTRSLARGQLKQVVKLQIGIAKM